ncbi:hypothetical protein ABID19_000974 [Mesorhizobium robiniae]|uniref:Uncharacterized protein n=1 Tax=Mesorhizobium robiniae TaxID=559315 RepID=A0ABV2GIV2_9HYPH
MANELLEAAKREADSLRAMLAKDPVFQKLQIVQKLIDSYEAFDAMDRAKPITAAARSPKAASVARPGTKLAQVENLVIVHTISTGLRATSGQLLPIVVNAGIELGGQVPAKTLSSMLSNSSRLNNLPGHGYGPAEWGESPGPGAEKDKTPADLLADVSSNTSHVPQGPMLVHQTGGN